LYVKIRFTDLNEAPVISWDEMQHRPLSRFKWSSFTSGVALPEVIVEELNRRWAAAQESFESLRPIAGKQNRDGQSRPHAPVVYSDLTSMRRDPGAARAVFDLIFESVTPECRHRWESLIADAIDYAAAKHPDRWAIVLEASSIRMTVGLVRCLQLSAAKDEIVLLSRTRAPPGTRWSGGQYEYGPGCEEAFVARAAGPRILVGIREACFVAIDACGTAHGGNHQRRRAHSPAVLRYLEEVVKRALPNPSYAAQVSDEVARETADWVENASIEAHPFADEFTEDLSILRDAALSPMEKEVLIEARRGLGAFRDTLLGVEPYCRVTGVRDPHHLIAGHIKPWSESSTVERLSQNNGLLLAPHINHLFAKGFISFADNGDLLISPRCPAEVLSAWGISRAINVGPFEQSQRPFLAYHRAYCFKVSA
jgi:hypothetical protein